MYNANKMNKRVVAFDEFHAMSPDEDDLFWVKPGDVKSFGEDQEMKSSSKSSSTRRRVEKKTKVRWTKDLHKKFLEAVGKLGIDKAVPKKIVELMKVDGLTRDHVASHLQKYRILSKKITNASLNNRVQTASKPSLLESSMTNDASWSQSSLMLNQEQMNQPSCGMHPISPLILDTSSSYFLTLDASKFNTTKNGYFTQAMTNNLNLEKQRNFVDDTTNSSVVNLVTSSNTGFVQYPESGFFHDYGGCSTEVQTYNNFEKGSSGGVPYSSNPPFVQNPNIFEISNYSSKKESVEIGSLYGASSNINLENGFSEDDMILSEDDMANLLSFADDYNLTASHDLSKQDMNGHNPPNTVSFYQNYQEHVSINRQPTFDAYLPSFEQTFVHLMDEQFVEPVWSPTLLQTIRQFKA